MKRTILAALLLAGACNAQHAPIGPLGEGAPAADRVEWSTAALLEVSLQDFAFNPSRIELARDRPYRLHLTNSGGGHNFDAPDFFRTVVFRDDPTAQKVRSSGGVIELAGGEAADIYVLPVRSGRYGLRCSHPLHSTFGMTGEIVVN